MDSNKAVLFPEFENATQGFPDAIESNYDDGLCPSQFCVICLRNWSKLHEVIRLIKQRLPELLKNAYSNKYNL